MQISLVRISLLQFFKTFHKYALREFWAIYFIIVIFWAKYLAKAFLAIHFITTICLMLILGYLFH